MKHSKPRAFQSTKAHVISFYFFFICQVVVINRSFNIVTHV